MGEDSHDRTEDQFCCEDYSSIPNLVIRFSDAVNRRDLSAFAALWSETGVWEIGDPLPARVEGRTAIVVLVTRLLTGRDLFVQMSHEGVIELNGDKATGRFTVEEIGRSSEPEKAFYHNYALYEDEFEKGSDGWCFLKRSYVYFYLDVSAIPGTSFPITADHQV